jgi:WD40 repeat protein
LTPPLEHGDVISQASIDRAGNYVLTCGDARKFRNGEYQLRGSGARVWSVKTGKLLMDVPSHGAGHSVWSAALSADGTHVATCAVDDPTVHVWDAVTGEPVLHFQTRGEVQFVMYNPDGTRLLTFWSHQAAAQQWDSRTGKAIGGELPSNADRYRHVVRPACYSADGKLLALAQNDQLHLYDTQRNVEIASVTDNPIPSRDIFMCIDLTPDGRLVAATALGCGSQVWDARTGHPVTDMLGGNGSEQAAISPDGKYLVFGGIDDQFAGICDVPTGDTIQRLPHIGWFSRVCFSPDGSLVALTSDLQDLTCIMKRDRSRPGEKKRDVSE